MVWPYTMRKSGHKAARSTERQAPRIDAKTAQDLVRIIKNAASYEEKPSHRTGEDGKQMTYVRLGFDEADMRDLKAHAKKLGVSVSTILHAAMELCFRDVTGEPLDPRAVEKLAGQGVSLLSKRDLN